MADYNRNRSNQNFGSGEDWDQNRRRYDREGDYDQNRNYGQVNYNDEDRYGYNRSNERKYGSAGYGSNYENEYSQGGYGTGRSGYYGGDQYRRQSDYNRDYSNTGYGEEEIGAPEAFRGNREYYRGGMGYMGGFDYRIADDNRNRDTQQRHYGAGSSSRGREDRDWWDRTRDEVSSWFGDDDAERRRDRDRRMSGNYKGKGPRGYTRSSERIKEDVCDRLSDDSYVDASEIDIKVDGSEVILSGTVHSREEKRRAEDLAESISGVSNVQNQLRVERQQEYASTSGNRITGDDSRRW
jgi:osmotically-inducible protein OsmY